MKYAAAFILSLTGCVTSAGPYVTSLAPGANGAVSVEKCKVDYLLGIGTISTGSCTTSTIYLQAPAAKTAEPAVVPAKKARR